MGRFGTEAPTTLEKRYLTQVANKESIKPPTYTTASARTSPVTTTTRALTRDALYAPKDEEPTRLTYTTGEATANQQQQQVTRPVTQVTRPPTETVRPTQEPTTAPEPIEPPAPESPQTSGSSDALGGFTEAEIEAALAALEAEFGMTREQLLSDQSLLGAQYRLLAARLARQREQATQAATSDAVSRGVYRSGILGEEVQDIETQFAEQQQEAEAQRLAQEQSIQTQLQFLEQQKAALQAQVQQGILRSTADIRRQAAGV